MKSKLARLLLIAVVAVASVFCWSVYAQKKQANKVVWEYNLVSSIGDNRSQLAELGNDGWELTSVRTEEQILGSYRQIKVYYYLKRAKQGGN